MQAVWAPEVKKHCVEKNRLRSALTHEISDKKNTAQQWGLNPTKNASSVLGASCNSFFAQSDVEGRETKSETTFEITVIMNPLDCKKNEKKKRKKITRTYISVSLQLSRSLGGAKSRD